MRKTKKGDGNITVCIIIFLIFMFLLLIASAFDNKQYKESYETIYVEHGNTLWNIAEEYKREDQDVREYIREIRKINNLESAEIFEGQEIQIIIYEEIN